MVDFEAEISFFGKARPSYYKLGQRGKNSHAPVVGQFEVHALTPCRVEHALRRAYCSPNSIRGGWFSLSVRVDGKEAGADGDAAAVEGGWDSGYVWRCGVRSDGSGPTPRLRSGQAPLAKKRREGWGTRANQVSVSREGKDGPPATNRTTQSEISNLLRHSFPGRVNRRRSKIYNGLFFGGRVATCLAWDALD